MSHLPSAPKARLAVLIVLLGALAAAAAPSRRQRPPSSPLRWFKGNTHTHTLLSDGDSPPETVAEWYRTHGYDFLVLSDHNVLAPVAALNAHHRDAFLIIPGEEVTDAAGTKPVHVNGLDLDEAVQPQHGDTPLEVIQRNVDAIRRARGTPHINHPNFRWSFSTDELRQVRNTRLLEIFNGHPMVNNLGGGGVPSVEEAWDRLLTDGILLFGIAVDDAHTFKDPGNPAVAGPGRGWVVVRAAALQPRAIVDALERGDFYASTGVELTDVVVTDRSLTVAVREDSWARYRIQFIGRGGRVLQETGTSPAEYVFHGDEGYVRARVLESNGRVAWGQPVMLARRR